MAKQKFYVVWDGAEDGVFTSWEACQRAVSGYSNAKYKAFKTEEEAEEAYNLGWEAYKEKSKEKTEMQESPEKPESLEKPDDPESPEKPEKPEKPDSPDNPDNPESPAPPHTSPPAMPPLPDCVGSQSIAVDAACSGNPGAMEYRGVYLLTGKEIFHYGPVYGTNNIGEFLAIVHGLALLKQKGLHTMPIYSDSVNAQLWVRKKKCKTTLERNERTEQLYQMIERAETWLKNNTYANPIIKWQTDKWGEIPADFGRK